MKRSRLRVLGGGTTKPELKRAPSVRVSTVLHFRVAAMLDRMTATGLYGRNRSETLEQVVCIYLRSLAREE